jgi:DNA-directed RNA polymerase subunit H (RpoH/RPB5)
MYHITIQQTQHMISSKHTTLSGNDVVAVFRKYDIVKSSSGGGYQKQ